MVLIGRLSFSPRAATVFEFFMPYTRVLQVDKEKKGPSEKEKENSSRLLIVIIPVRFALNLRAHNNESFVCFYIVNLLDSISKEKQKPSPNHLEYSHIKKISSKRTTTRCWKWPSDYRLVCWLYTHSYIHTRSGVHIRELSCWLERSVSLS